MLSVRPGRLEDCEALSVILNEIIKIGGTTAYQTPLTPDYFRPFIESSDPKVFLHVAQAEDMVLGLQWVEPLDPPDEHIGAIATFAKPGATQRGIGSALFQATKAASLAVGFTELTAVIRADNSGGLAYYERMGFRDHAVRVAVPLRDGTPVDRIEKRLVL